MNERLIADHLRAACSQGVIVAWSRAAKNVWYIQGSEHTLEYDTAGANAYAEMLADAGIEPLPIRWPHG